MSDSLRIRPYQEAKFQVFDAGQLLATFISLNDAIEYVRQTKGTQAARTWDDGQEEVISPANA